MMILKIIIIKLLLSWKNNENSNKDNYYKYYEKKVYEINNFSVSYNNNY